LCWWKYERGNCNARLLERTLVIYLDIAAQHKDAGDERCQRMDQDISAALLELYREMGGTQSEAVFNEVMAMDIRLNAQGLDVWLG